MLRPRMKFGILLCGKKELMDGSRTITMKTGEVHLQYSSSPNFLISRAMFHTPNLILIDTQCDRRLVAEVFSMLRSQFRDTPVHMISSSPNYHDAVHFMKLGARG